MNKSKSLRLAGTLLLSIFSLVSCRKPKVSSPINSLTPSVSDTATGNSVSNSPSTPDSSSSSGTSQKAPNDLVKVTINNGASSANVEGETVNALHVYSYDIDESGDDFLSGTEIPKGTEVKLFVYNYASAVELNLSNGDEKITRQYPAITPYVDDDKVEHITFIAKGDIVAETKAIDKLTTQTKAVKIKGLKRNNKDVSFSYMNRKGSGEAAEMKELLFTSYLNDGYDLLVSLANAGSKVYDITAAINGEAYELPEPMSSLEANSNGGLFFPADVLKGDVVLTFSERKAIYHISVKGLDEGVTSLFASMAKEDAKPTVISDGKITAGNILRCMFINTTENEYDVEVLVGGTKRTLSEKETIVTKDGGGFTIPSAELIADVTVTLKKGVWISEKTNRSTR